MPVRLPSIAAFAVILLAGCSSPPPDPADEPTTAPPPTFGTTTSTSTSATAAAEPPPCREHEGTALPVEWRGYHKPTTQRGLDVDARAARDQRLHAHAQGDHQDAPSFPSHLSLGALGVSLSLLDNGTHLVEMHIGEGATDAGLDTASDPRLDVWSNGTVLPEGLYWLKACWEFGAGPGIPRTATQVSVVFEVG